VGLTIVIGVIVAAFEYDKLPFISDSNDYSAVFRRSGAAIKSGNTVRVSGMGVGRVSSVSFGRHQGPGQLHGSQRTSNWATAPKPPSRPRTILGAKNARAKAAWRRTADGPPFRWNVPSRPYDLPDALGDLTTTISGLDTTPIILSTQHISEHLQGDTSGSETRIAGRGQVLGTP